VTLTTQKYLVVKPARVNSALVYSLFAVKCPYCHHYVIASNFELRSSDNVANCPYSVVEVADHLLTVFLVQ